MRGRFLLGVLAVAMLAAAAFAVEPPALTKLRAKLAQVTVSATFVDVPLAEVLDYLGTQGGVPVQADPDAKAEGAPLAKAKVSLQFDRTPLSEAVQRAADEFGMRVNAMGGILWLSRRGLPYLDWPELPEPTVRALDGRALTLKFEATPLADALKAVSDQSGAPIRTEPALAKLPVTLAANQMTPRAIVTWIAMLQGLQLRADGAALVVTWSPFDAKVRRQLDETLVSFTFNEQPVMEAIDFLQTLGRLNIVPDRSKFDDPAKTVTLKCDNVPLREAMDRLAKELGLTWVVRDGVVFISDASGVKPPAVPGEPRWFALDRPTAADRKALQQLEETIVSFTFNEQPVFEAFDFLQTLGKVNIVADRSKLDDPAKTVTLRLHDVPVSTALKLLAEQLGMRLIIVHGIVFVSDEATVKGLVGRAHRDFAADKPTDADRQALKKLDETVVSFTFNEQPVYEAIDFLQTLGKLNIVPDRSKFTDPKRTVTLKLENVPLRAALTLLTEQLGLDWIIREGVVYISDAATVKGLVGRAHRDFAAEAPTDADRQALKMIDETIVSFTFNEQPVMEALDYLQTLGKVGVSMETVKLEDPAAPKNKITLKLQNVPLRTAWTLIAEQLGMDWVIKDGAVHVTDKQPRG